MSSDDSRSFESLTLERVPNLRLQVDAELPRGVFGVDRLTIDANVPDVAAVCSLDGNLFAVNLTALAVLEEIAEPTGIALVVERFQHLVSPEDQSRVAVDIRALVYDLQEMGLVRIDS